MKNSSLVLGYPLYITDVYKILLPWCIRLKTILLQAAYHDYSKLRTLKTASETGTSKYPVLTIPVMVNTQ